MTARLTHRANDLLERISARLAFRNRLNAIERKSPAQIFFKLQLKSFPLELLGSLFCFFLQILNLELHRGNLGFFFCDLELEVLFLELEFLFYFLFRFPPHFLNGGLDALFHRKVYFTFGDVKFALFAESISFSLLRLLQFLVTLLEGFLEFFHFLCLCIQVGRGGEFRFFSFFLRNRGSFCFQFFRNSLINRASFSLNLFSPGVDFFLAL